MSAVARSVARLTTIAAVVLLAGCGGGSGNKSAGTESTAGAGSAAGSRLATARQGAFRTVVPVGFHHLSAQTQYNVEGDGARGGIVLLVIREPAALGGINAFARRVLSAARHEAGVHRLSGPTPLSVAGEPALRVGYAASEKTGESNILQVLVRHRGWVYFIRGANGANDF